MTTRKAKPIFLSYETAVAKARYAYERGRLSAQGPTPACKYRDASGLPCAVGASLDARTARRFDAQAEASVEGLEASDFLHTDDPYSLNNLQGVHDDWVLTVFNRGPEAARYKENEFRTLIGLEPLPVAEG